MHAVLRISLIALAALGAAGAPLDSQAYGRGGGYGHGYGHGHGPHGGRGHFWGGFGLGVGLGFGASYGASYGAYYGGPWAPGYVMAVPGTAYVESAPVPLALSLRSAPDPIVYPRNGQSPAQTEADRQACDRWAASQPSAMADASVFHRATLACLDGRGYTVR